MKHSRRRSARKRSRYNSGGSTLLDLIVPGGLFAATQFAKRRSKKHVRGANYLVEQNNKKSRRRRRRY